MLSRARKERIGIAISQLINRHARTAQYTPCKEQMGVLQRLLDCSLAGELVILRRVHDSLDMDQAAALRWVRDLETQQLIEIEAHPHDLLEAKISVAEKGVLWLKHAKQALKE